MRPVLYWMPRALGIAFVAFTLLFAGDASSASHSIGQNLVALAMHLVPTAIAAGLLMMPGNGKSWEGRSI